MLKGKRAAAVYFLVSLMTYAHLVQAQSDSKYFARVGPEFANYFSSQTGSFTKRDGYSFGFGYLTGPELNKDSASAVLFGMELNYTKIFRYRTNVTNFQWVDQYQTYELNDNECELAFIDYGLSIEPSFLISDNMIFAFSAGASIGIGSSGLTPHLKSVTTIVTTYGPNSEGTPYGGDSFEFPICFNFGLNYYYKRLLVDIRYRYILPTVKGGNDPIQSFNSFYAQLGFVL